MMTTQPKKRENPSSIRRQCKSITHPHAFSVFYLVVACTTALLSMSTTVDAICECTSVESWSELVDIIEESRLSTARPPHVVLCPFEIDRARSPSLDIDHSVSIQCQKMNPDDNCVISSAKCRRWCKSPIRIMSDNVKLQGITLRDSDSPTILVEDGAKSVHLVDMDFTKNRNIYHGDKSIVYAEKDTSVSIIDSRFTSNTGTAVKNDGQMIVVASSFQSNNAFAMAVSNDMRGSSNVVVAGAIQNNEGGTLFVSDSSFINNRSPKSGPAIYSFAQNGYDAGGNCGIGNERTYRSLGTCDGIYYNDIPNEQDRCVPFGATCATS